VAACVLCATALEAMEAGERAGHICTHQQIEQDDEQTSKTGSEPPADPPPRGGKHKQPDEFVVRQYMDEKLDALVQAVAILGPLLDEDSEKDYENHLLQWSGYCEGLKERARELIALIQAGNVSQVEKDQLFALNLAVQQGRGVDGRSGDVDGGPGGGGAAVTHTGDQQSDSLPFIQTSQSLTAPAVTTTHHQTPHTSTSIVSATVPAQAPSTSTGIGGGV
jgi:hypothetical protein